MLDQTKSTIAGQRSTRSEPLTDADMHALLGSARRVLIARGRSHREISAREVALDQLKGPTGNYRAPMLLVGSTLLVGFSAELLDALLAG